MKSVMDSVTLFKRFIKISQYPGMVCSADMLRCHRASPGCNNNEVM